MNARRRVAVHVAAAAVTLGAVTVAPAPAAAQSAIGRVLENGTQRLLADVTVTLLDATGRAAAQTTTDRGGNFYLDAPAPGRYALAFTWGGATLTTAPRMLGKDQEVQAEYYLAAAATSATDPRVRDVPAGVTPPRPLPGNPTPQYPDAARQYGVNATVLAKFVVDTTGRVDMGTLVFLQSGGADFDSAVRNALSQMRYEPARASDGRKVPQVVVHVFSFSSIGVPGVEP